MPASRNNDSPVNGLKSHRLDGFISSLFGAATYGERLQAICGIACEAAGAIGVAVLSRHQGNVRAVAASPPISAETGEAPSWLVDLAKSYGQMLAENCQTVVLRPGPGGAHGVYVPLLGNGEGGLALAAYVMGGRQIRLQSVSGILQLVRVSLSLMERITPSAENGAAQAGGSSGESALQGVLDVVGEVQACTRFFEACTTLCTAVASEFDCRRVALGVVRSDHAKAVALDQMESFSRGTRSVRQLEEVMQEALDQNRIIFYSNVEGESDEAGAINRAARELAISSNARRVLTLPLRVSGQSSFVLVAVMDKEEFSSSRLDALSLVCRLAAPRLHDLELVEELPLKKLWRYILLKSGDLFGPRRTVLKLASFLVAAFLAVTLLLSGEIVVSAPLAIEGVHSYTHTAPMDSYLSEVLARPGDEVKKGDILGRLDATEIDLEISALEAQKSIHESQAAQYLQEGKDAEAAIARLEAERTVANLAWARERLDMTELKSSVDGFLISEDMFPRLGQPVRRGQELFEVTDTGSLRVVVHVDESDISDINRARVQGPVRGEFTLTAYPDLHISFFVERIHPFTSVAGASNGFEVRGRIADNSPQGLVLRPGMEGYARISAGEKPLLVLWTRKVVNKIRLLWWRWI